MANVKVHKNLVLSISRQTHKKKYTYDSYRGNE
jgi:hypothetical protein